ncbi:MAG: leucine-rich repeat domain-containing protein [Cytophaga sp.]|uniref:leucine-rich repeat domain-containing protein n=1 Tax=Cytophaga sp. TaxID=29535 RepID=UPI003F7FAA99
MKTALHIARLKKSFLLGSILLLMLGNTAFAQLYTIPDPAFRNKLMSSYPSVMTGTKLNTTAAKNFTADLLLIGAGISDLTGIEYFSSVYKIDASFNSLTTIPDISNTVNLKYLYLNYNQITTLPDLSALKNLLELQLNNNKLVSLPPLNALTSLDYLFLTTNKLTILPDISALTNIRYILIGDNPFTSLPDFSPNANLLELHCHQTGISEIKGLSALTKLTKLYCWENNITDLSALSANTSLTGLYASNNLLTNLPTLTNKPNLANVEIASNKLTFEDLLPITTMPGITDFSYSPQDSIGVYSSRTIRLKHPISFDITEDAAVTSNVYSWFKDAAALTTTTAAPLVIPSAQQSDAGSYYVNITNPNLPLLTLSHRLWDIDITNCIDLTSYSFNVPFNDCKIGATVQSIVVMAGGTAPYTYTLTPLAAADPVVSTSGDFTKLAPGQYTYTIRDANNCGIDTVATIKKPAGCDPVIMPSGDPQMNSYFIEQTGTAKIIDLSGHTIVQLSVPAVWYGTKADGSLADAGYYVIVVNDKKVTNITVIR